MLKPQTQMSSLRILSANSHRRISKLKSYSKNNHNTNTVLSNRQDKSQPKNNKELDYETEENTPIVDQNAISFLNVKMQTNKNEYKKIKHNVNSRA